MRGHLQFCYNAGMKTELLLATLLAMSAGFTTLAAVLVASDLKPDVPKPRVRGYDRPGMRRRGKMPRLPVGKCAVMAF